MRGLAVFLERNSKFECLRSRLAHFIRIASHATRKAATKPLAWRNILVSKQSARVTHRIRRRHYRSYAVSSGPVTRLDQVAHSRAGRRPVLERRAGGAARGGPSPRPRCGDRSAARQAQPAARHPLLSRDGDGARWRSPPATRMPTRCAALRSSAADRPSVRRRPAARFRASRPSRAWRTSPTPARCTGSAPASSICSAAAMPARRRRSCSTSTTPTTWCTASRSWRCSTPTRAAIASSRSTSSRRARASRSCRCFDRASGRRGRRSRACSPMSSIASAGAGPRLPFWCAATATTAPEVLDLLRQKRCDYVLGLSRNKTLDALAEPWREQCRWHWKPGPKVRRFHQLQYAAETWTREEKVIARVEATELGTDARFIVTNLTGRASISTRRSTAHADAWRT